jgi:uncharacterized delta-60 repeat protein
MVLEAEIASNEPQAITERGFVYALSLTNGAPEIGGTGVTKLVASVTQDGRCSALASGLTPRAAYSCRSYATSAAGTAYSAVVSFTTVEFGSVAGDLETGFHPSGLDYGWSVSCLAIQPDGKTLIGFAYGVGGCRIVRANPDGSLESGFMLNEDGNVETIAVQPDGKIVFGGGFASVNGIRRNRIARIHGNASLDNGFDPDANGSVRSIAIQSDGKVLIGGSFTTVGGVPRNRVARLNADGSLDMGFNPDADNDVGSIATQSDGKVLIGGSFTTVGGVTRNRIARLNADGSLDIGFNPDAGNHVASLAMQADGKVLVGGAFTMLGGIPRNRIARLNADGSVDAGFNPDAGNGVSSIAVQSDGRVIIGGSFTTVSGIPRNRVARLNIDGKLDLTFNPDANRDVYTLAVQGDGKVMIGGSFLSMGGEWRNGIARVNNNPAVQSLTVPDARRVLWSRGGTAPELRDVVFEQSLDNGATWSPLGKGVRIGATAEWELVGLSLGVETKVRATGRPSDGRGSGGLVRQASPMTLAGLSLDLIAVPTTGSADGGGTAAMILGGGTMSDGGGITEMGFVYAMSVDNLTPEIGGTGVTKLAVPGTQMGSFNALATGLAPGTTYSYRTYAQNQAGTAYSWVGTFITAAVGAGPGDLDANFVPPSVDGAVNTLALQPDGKMLIGGAFHTIGGVTRNRVARLNADCSLDTSFAPLVADDAIQNFEVYTLTVQSDGKVLIGGGFTRVGGLRRNRIARLNADGSVDKGFNPNANGWVTSLAVQTDGKVLIGGWFTTVGGARRTRIARLHADGSIDTSFDSDVNDTVSSIGVLSDGKVLIGGRFTTVGGAARNRIARLHSDGSPDDDFYSDVNDEVASFAVQADGKVLVGGWFTTVGGIMRNRIARLHSDGSLDNDFNPDANYGVSQLVVQTDGSVLIGGNFTTIGGITRNRIARLNPDGKLDTTFKPNANAAVYSLALQPDGKVLIGGSFGEVNGVARKIARLNSGSATQIMEMQDSKRLLWIRGGSAPELGDVVFEQSEDNGATWSHLGTGARVGMTTDWELTGFSLRAGNKVRATGRASDGRSSALIRQAAPMTLAVVGPNLSAMPTTGSVDAGGTAAMIVSGVIISDGGGLTERGFVYSLSTTNSVPEIGATGVTKLVAGVTGVGSFSALATGLKPGMTYSYRTYATNSVGTVYSAVGTFITKAFGAVGGDLDTSFDPSVGGDVGTDAVHSLAVQPDGKVLVGGSFTQVGGLGRNCIARLNTDGKLDEGFHSDVDKTVYRMTVQADGKIIIAGSFTTVAGVPRSRIARLNADGSLDTGFDPNLNGTVHALVMQADGKMIVGGAFTAAGGVTRNRIARLNADGSLDTDFSTDVNSDVQSLALQPDGKLLIGGDFTIVGGITRNSIARLMADGSLDTGFDPNVHGGIDSLTLQPDGKVLIGGWFDAVGGIIRNSIARLNEDGSLDLRFNPDVNNDVENIVVQADGKVLIGGYFTTVGGVNRNRIARLHSDGSLDDGFNPDVANGGVVSLAVQNDGAVLIGGGFTTLGGIARYRIARVSNEPAWHALTVPDAMRVVWTRGGSTPSLDQVFFEGSLDNGATWSFLGEGSRLGAGEDWELAGLSLNAATKVRATGRTSDGEGSGGLIREAFPMTLASVDPATTAIVASESASGGKRAMRLGGALKADGGGVTELGFVYAANPTSVAPEIGGTGVTKLAASGTWLGRFSAVATGLMPGTIYSYRSYATNSAGTAYSAVGTFITSAAGTVAGDFDVGFNSNPNSAVICLAIQADRKLLIGGWFTTVSGVTRNRIARLDADGRLEGGFNPNVNQSVECIAVQADGRIIIGGGFTAVGGMARGYVARLHADGSVDSSFNPNANGWVTSLALQADGKVLIGGSFTAVSGVTRNRLARLNADGSLDGGFNPNSNGSVNSMAVQGDGKVLIGGAFTTIGGVSRARVARLKNDGSIDTSFIDANANSMVESLALQADGRVLIGGRFNQVGGVARFSIARLNTDGSLDSGFNPAAYSVYALAVQADGKILVGGDFTTVGGLARNRIARLSPDGSVDTGFNPDVGSAVYSIALQGDGKPLIGGNFNIVGGVACACIARLHNEPATQALTVPDTTRVLWMRGGTAPELDLVVFEQSLDNGTTWSLVGTGIRVGLTADWELTGLSLGEGTKVRATGRSNTSGLIRQDNQSVGVGALSSTVVSPIAATLGATVTGDGVVGSIRERGFVYAPTAMNGDPFMDGAAVVRVVCAGTTGAFAAQLTGLAPGTRYSFKAYVIGSEGSIYTSVGSFVTLTIREGWRQDHFGMSENTGDASDGADPDNDGLANLVEHALNLPPNVASSLRAEIQKTGDGVEYTYTRSTAARHGGAIVQVEWSNDLETWSTKGVVETQLSDDGTTQQVKVKLPAGADGRGFVRLRVQ